MTKRIKESKAREDLEAVIQVQFEIATTAEKESTRTNAANTYKGLVKDYKELFGFEPEEKGEMKLVGKKKNISGYAKNK